MNSRRISLTVPVLMVLASAFLMAEVIPGRWEKVEALASGTPIKVELETGDRLEGAFVELIDGSLLLKRDGGPSSAIPKQTVKKIFEVTPVQGQARKPILIGAGIGFGIGFLATVAWEKSITASGYRLAEENLSLALAGGALGSGVGALTGWALHKATEKVQLIYVSQKSGAINH